jgi:nucleoporin p58/p45
LHTAKSFLSSDESLLQQIQALSEKDKRSISLSVNVLNYFKHNRPGFNSGTPIEISILPPPQDGEVANNSTMVAYFNDHGQQMEDKLRIFLESVAEVEASLRSVEDQAGSMEGGINGAQQRKELVGGGGKQLNKALRSFHEALQDVGGRLVEVKDGLRALEGNGNKGRTGW